MVDGHIQGRPDKPGNEFSENSINLEGFELKGRGTSGFRRFLRDASNGPIYVGINGNKKRN